MYDAHVHVGYYSRIGREEPFYYSPRRVVGVLRRCGVEDFIVSSTCAQVECFPLADILREAREMRRVADACAHQFFWLTGRFYDVDRELKVLDTGLYEGLKLHELETPWMGARRRDLERVLAIAEERRLPVQFHCGPEPCSPRALAKIAAKFPSVNFDFAHCSPMDEMAEVISDLPNVWTDVAWLADDAWAQLGDYDWHGRIMFGSDFPAYHAKEELRVLEEYRRKLFCWQSVGFDGQKAFHRFLKK